ncbi:MAG TPA: hypothetical protein ENH10_10235 [Bacteroidetes bacterium]|nr:ribosome maturation protein RimP [bacterium BMS3Bbin04]HDO66384.1 hypothetical protein [Bacteroidota bacterium]HEX05509.1 hypothetical protein [Bacteroidota bacterium]
MSVEKIANLLRSMLDGTDLELLDLKVLGSKGRTMVYAILDHRLRPVGIGELTKISRRFEDLLDMDQDVPREYALNVTSPGIDHPLTHEWEYAKNVGRKLSVQLVTADDRGTSATSEDKQSPSQVGNPYKKGAGSIEQFETFDGELTEVREGELHFADGRTVPLQQVHEAKVKLPW